LAIIAEIRTRALNGASLAASIERNAIADSNARNAEVLKAMGFASRAVRRFAVANEKNLALQTKTSDISSTYGAISRVLRMLLQSAICNLGVGGLSDDYGPVIGGCDYCCHDCRGTGDGAD
jgi:ATP-binding cassette, subfamily C, bacterial